MDVLRAIIASFEQVMKDSGQARNTNKAARRELEEARKLASQPGGKYQGEAPPRCQGRGG